MQVTERIESFCVKEKIFSQLAHATARIIFAAKVFGKCLGDFHEVFQVRISNYYVVKLKQTKICILCVFSLRIFVEETTLLRW